MRFVARSFAAVLNPDRMALRVMWIALLVAQLAPGQTQAQARAPITIPICTVDRTICIDVEVPTPLYEAEMSWCQQSASNLLDCVEAYGLHAARGANDAQNRLWPDTNPNVRDLRDWQRDAFRHCYWSARLRIAMTEDKARGFLERHEQVACNPHDERVMDENNNELGLSLGEDALRNVPSGGPVGDANQPRYVWAEERCDTFVRDGVLATIRKDAQGNHEVVYGEGNTIYSGLHVMPVGDSITHGRAGDYTWRYRLGEHFRTSAVRYDFVGPYSKPSGGGGYAVAGWDTQHAAKWGQAAFEAANLIEDQISAHWPDVLLVHLGTNDLTWWAGTPEQARDSIATLVANARRCRPDVDVVLGQIGATRSIDDAKAQRYSQLLAQLAGSLSTPASRVVTANVAGAWNWSTDTYDGTHPNARGEYVIAKAFADSLKANFNVGKAFGPIPLLPPPPPSDIVINPNPVRPAQPFTISWPRVDNPGIWTEYKVEIRYHREFGFGLVWASAGTTPNTSITYDGPPLPQEGTFHVVVVAVDINGQQASSEPVPLVARHAPPSPPPPRSIRLAPARIGRDGGFIASWDRVVNPGVWTEYKVQLRYHRDFGFGLIWESATSTPDLQLVYDGPRLPQTGTYHVVVVATDIFGQETSSEPTPLTVQQSIPPPLPPANVRVGPNRINRSSPFTVSWDRVPNPKVWTEYQVELHNHATFGYGLVWASRSTPNLSVTYNGPRLPQSGTYQVAVVATDMHGQRTSSAPVDLVVTDEPSPPKPRAIVLTPSTIPIGNRFTVTWPRVNNPGIWTEYRVEVRNHMAYGFGLVWRSPQTPDLSVRYDGPALTGGVYHVVVWSTDGRQEAMSDPVPLTVEASYAAP